MTGTFQIAVCKRCDTQHSQGYEGVPCFQDGCSGEYEMIEVIERPGKANTVTEPYECEKCGSARWYMGYEDTGEFVNECVNCGNVFLP